MAENMGSVPDIPGYFGYLTAAEARFFNSPLLPFFLSSQP